MPGPSPKPSRLKEIHGTGQAKATEPKPLRVELPSAPSYLDERATELWNKLAPELSRLGLLTIVDLEALAAACMSFSLAVQAAHQIKTEGLIVPDGQNRSHKNPAFQILRDSLATYKSFAQEFGLTPSSRTRLSADVEDDLSDLVSLLD